jgi:hypothetical protein
MDEKAREQQTFMVHDALKHRLHQPRKLAVWVGAGSPAMTSSSHEMEKENGRQARNATAINPYDGGHSPWQTEQARPGFQV